MSAEPRSLVRYGSKEPADDPLESDTPLTIVDKTGNSTLSSKISEQRTRTSLLPSIVSDRLDDADAIQTILDCILPARTFESEGKVWRQGVSSTPATRLDVLNLQQQLDAALDERHAKKFGVCPIRRDIYDQLFDELIRQVAVNCAERGLLLMRVRDELRLTNATYQSLLESAVAYGLRKALLVEQQQSQAAVERDQERQRNVDLIAKVEQLELNLAEERRVNEEELALLEERMTEDNQRLREANNTLKYQLQALLQLDQEAKVAEQDCIDDSEVVIQCPHCQHRSSPAELSLRTADTTLLLAPDEQTESVICVVLLELIPSCIIMAAVIICVVILLGKLG